MPNLLESAKKLNEIGCIVTTCQLREEDVKYKNGSVKIKKKIMNE